MKLITVRGGGDIATGTIHALSRLGFDVLVLECAKPSAIRRKAAFSEAVYDGEAAVEGKTAVLAENISDAKDIMQSGKIAVLVDEKAEAIKKLEPLAVIDGILAKKNIGTSIDMAPAVIALGPGFCAGKDCHAVIETMRGHNLGRVIYSGCALKNTGVPGVIAGYSSERVIHAANDGVLKSVKSIGDIVEKGEIIAYAGAEPVYATLSGVLRGLIRDGYFVTKGFKTADIDPRIDEQKNCFTISDKARCVASGAIQALFELLIKRGYSYDLSR